jgi:uncharacterized coiled-coil protein SlyX
MEYDRVSLCACVLATLMALPHVPARAQPQDPADAVRQLQQQLAEQRALIEAQQRQIDRLVDRIEGRTVAAAPASAPMPTTPAAVGPNTSTSTLPAAASQASSETVHAPLAVASRFDGIKLTLGGAVRTTVLSMSARSQPDGTPFFLLPDLSQEQGSTKFDARSSSFSLAIEGLQYEGYRFGGQMIFQFSNGNLLSGGYGFTPYVAFVEARHETARYAMGLQEDVFSPRIPKMVDSVSALAASGNPGNSSRAQLRAERYFAFDGGDRLAVVGALSDSLPQTIDPQFSQITENVGWPNAEARLAWTRTGLAAESWLPWAESEFGTSGALGRFRTVFPSDERKSFDTTFWGLAIDARVRLGKQAGFQGEVYAARSLGPCLGTVLQTVNLGTGQPIRSDGGWGEFAWYWTPSVHSHDGAAEMRRSWGLPAGEP